MKLHPLFALVRVGLLIFLQKSHSLRLYPELIFIVIKLVCAVYKYKSAVLYRGYLSHTLWVDKHIGGKGICVIAEGKG